MISEPNRRSARLAAAAFLVSLFALRPSEAFELRAWPLLDVERHGADSRVQLLGPLVEWRRDGDVHSFALRPLLETSRSETSGTSRGSILYPLASWNRMEAEFSLRFLGLGSYVKRAVPLPDRPDTRELRIFPILFYHRGPETGPSLSVVPLYANLEHFFGYERVRMLLFPLFLRLEEPLYTRTWLPFPFFSRVGGRAGEGTRVWPIYGHTILASDYETRYIGWPFYIRAVAHPGSEGEVTTRISWPLFSTLDGPQIHSRSYAFLLILPLYTHTLDLRTGADIEGFPWPFWTIERDAKTGERRSIRLMPVYERRTTATMESVFYFWPFYRRHTGLGESAGYRRSDVLFLFYRDQIEGETPARGHIRAIVPFWVSREEYGAGDGQSIALLDGLFPKNETLKTLYAPLYRIYGEESREGRVRRDFFWGMVRSEDGKVRPPWYFSRD